jgi:hypothetical protein
LLQVKMREDRETDDLVRQKEDELKGYAPPPRVCACVRERESACGCVCGCVCVTCVCGCLCVTCV